MIEKYHAEIISLSAGFVVCIKRYFMWWLDDRGFLSTNWRVQRAIWYEPSNVLVNCVFKTKEEAEKSARDYLLIVSGLDAVEQSHDNG